MIRVAFQGERGAYSELAVRALRPGALAVPYRDNVDVVHAVACGEVDAGVLPIENSVAGTVAATLDALLESEGVCITAEAVVPIDLCLLGVSGASMADVRWVESHEVALAQCRTFFASHPALQPRVAYDTAGAARDIALAGDRQRAAIASVAAAARYGMVVLQAALQDSASNRTRFIELSRHPRTPEGHSPCRTSMAITTEAGAGALSHLRTAVARAGLRVTTLGHAPLEPATSHRFVLEVHHRAGDDRVDAIIGACDTAIRSCRILGTFPVAAGAW